MVVQRYQIEFAGMLPSRAPRAYIIDTVTGEFILTELESGRFEDLKQ